MPLSLAPPAVDQRQRSVVEPEQTNQLRLGAAQQDGGLLGLGVGGGQHVQGFGQEGREVSVRKAHFQPTLASRLPKRAGLVGFAARTADVEGQIGPQPMEGDRAVLVLTATLAGLGRDARGKMSQADGRLDLVAMLPAGA